MRLDARVVAADADPQQLDLLVRPGIQIGQQQREPGFEYRSSCQGRGACGPPGAPGGAPGRGLSRRSAAAGAAAAASAWAASAAATTSGGAGGCANGMVCAQLTKAALKRAEPGELVELVQSAKEGLPTAHRQAAIA